MNISFYNGVSGMLAYQENLNQISHNIANSNTVGYKPSRSTFDDPLYTHMAVNNEKTPLVGHGVKIEDSKFVYRQGPVLQTEKELDFALMGDGFFAVRRPDGRVEYTRNGAFDISLEGSKGFLVTADGSHVLDARGRAISLSRKSADSPFDVSDLADRIGVYDFPNPYGLEHSAGCCFKATVASGRAEAVKNRGNNTNRIYNLVSRALEQSAVELADEMVGVITAQKAYQLNARMVQTADQLEEIVNNLR